MRARLAERFLAVFADALLFFLAFRLAVALATRWVPVFPIPLFWAWTLCWAAGFVLYLAFFGAHGRATLGRKLLGLTVVDEFGVPLTFRQSLLRCFLLCDAQVVEFAEKPGWLRVLLTVCACLAAALGAFFAVWAGLLEPHLAHQALMTEARLTLNDVRELENAYRRGHGRYTDSLAELARLEPRPARLEARVAALFEPGFGIRLLGRDSYAVNGRVRDARKTPVSMEVEDADLQSGPAGDR